MPGQIVPQTILDEIGWNNRYAIPIANAENKRLEDELLNLNRQVQQFQGKHARDVDRVEAITEHLKNVRAELNHTQALHEAQLKARETEDHMRKVAEREAGRLQQEINKLDKDLQEQKERKNFFENTIFKQTQHLEQKKSQNNWDNQALDAWLKECKRREDDAMTLAKYTREDDEKIREVTLKTNNLTDELAKKKRQLDNESMDTKTAEVELDKTAEEFRKAHIERQQLLHQWEQTIDQMSKRDQEMNMLALELEQTKADVRNKENLCKEKLQFLLDAQGNNQNAEIQIKKAEREVAAVKMQHQQAEKDCNELQSSLDSLKRQADRTNSELEMARADVTLFKQEVNDKKKKLEHVKALVKELQEKLEQTLNAKMSSEERSARLVELLHNEEFGVMTLNTELKQLRDIHYTRSQELTNLKSQLKIIEVEMQGTRSTIVNLNSKIREKDKEILRQEEMIYNYDLSIQAAQRIVSLMEGEQTNEEKVALEGRVRELKKNLNERVSLRNLLTAENKRQEDEVRKTKRLLETIAVNKEDLKQKIEELELHIDNAQRTLKKNINEKQDKMVDKNLLDLRVKKLLEQLHLQADGVLSQEKHRLKLETAMKERKLEIDIHTKMLTAQLRDAEDQRRDTNIQLQERISRIERLRKRYESIIVMMAPPEGEEEHSQSYYVIKAAQEKEELQRTGDELDAKIRKAEKEICALRNTLKVMRSSNEVLRKDQGKVMDNSDEFQEKHELDEQHKTLIDKFRHKRGLLRERQEDSQRMIANRDTMIHEEEMLAKRIEEKQEKLLQLTKDVEDQLMKLNRVNKLNLKLLREIRNIKKVKEANEEQDIDLRDLRDLNKKALKQMSESVDKHPELVSSIQIYFEQAGLPIPASSSMPGSRSSSGSLTSLRSSLFSSGSLSSVRSGSSQGSMKRGHHEPVVSIKGKQSAADQFTVFGDELIVKPPSGGSSRSSRTSSLRSGFSRSSATLKEIVDLGDDFMIRGSGQSAPTAVRSDHSLSRTGKGQPSLTHETVTEQGKRGTSASSKQSTARSQRESKRPSQDNTFAIFGSELEIRAPSQQSSESNTSNRGSRSGTR